jgi:hypothetical protein
MPSCQKHDPLDSVEMMRLQSLKFVAVRHRLAGERGVQGVAEMVAYRRITTIAAMREGLVFPSAHRFPEVDAAPSEPSSSAVTGSRMMASQKRRSAAPDDASDPTSGSKWREPSSSSSSSSSSIKSKLVHDGLGKQRSSSSSSSMSTDKNKLSGVGGWPAYIFLALPGNFYIWCCSELRLQVLAA